MITKQKRPKFLNLMQIHLPVTGVNSFAHRVSGFLLFLSLPALIYMFNLSLRDAASLEALLHHLQTPAVRFVFTILAWAIGHHLLAGIRFLLAELDVATSLPASRRLAWIINLSGVLIFLIAAYLIWS